MGQPCVCPGKARQGMLSMGHPANSLTCLLTAATHQRPAETKVIAMPSKQPKRTNPCEELWGWQLWQEHRLGAGLHKGLRLSRQLSPHSPCAEHLLWQPWPSLLPAAWERSTKGHILHQTPCVSIPLPHGLGSRKASCAHHSPRVN